MAQHGYIGRFYWNSVSNAVGITTTYANINSGYYYVQGYGDGSGSTYTDYTETSENLLYSVALAMNTCGASPTSAYIDMSLSEPRVKITFSGSTKIYMHGNLAILLGFTQSGAYDPVSAASYTATYPPRYCWFPRSDVSYTDVDRNNFWEPMSTSKNFRSINGKCYGIKGNLLYGNKIRYTLLSKEEVLTTSTADTNEPFQKFFEDVIHETQPFRVLLDRETHAVNGYTNSSSVYVTAMYGPNDEDVKEKVGNFTTFASRNIENYQGLWDIELPMVKYI